MSTCQITTPKIELRKVCNALGEPYRPEMLNYNLNTGAPEMARIFNALPELAQGSAASQAAYGELDIDKP